MFQVVLFIFIVLEVSFALDLELTNEGPCLDVESYPLDPSWFQNSSTKWFTPLISKYELYRYAEDLIGKKSENISDKELKNLCPTNTINVEKSLSFLAVGAGGASFIYETKLGENNTFFFRVKGHKDWDKGSITKVGTDYFVWVSCWHTGIRGWSVNTKFDGNLSDSVKEEAIEHLKSLGFKDLKYYYQYSYDECKNIANEGHCIKSCRQN